MGFFLEKDTYHKNVVALQPFTENIIDENKYLQSSTSYWNWSYSPRDITLNQATEEFADLFEKITFAKLKGKKIILPLSGGIDSRTQAAVLNDEYKVHAYSYKFECSFDETKYGREISEIKSFPFKDYTIQKGYLWNVIEELAEVNQCYADFTHPRQMAVINEISKLGNIFYLGHWGDVLFDNMNLDERLTTQDQIEILKKKILKSCGVELAESLWSSWGIEGKFEDYLNERIINLFENIKIDNPNSRIRAFKSIYWAPRWTSCNMVVFSNYAPVALPYYDDAMCKFICTVPEHLLTGRQIQINYIKMKNPKLAKVAWQNFDPLNLYNFADYKSKKMIPLRVLRKGKRILRERILREKTTTRNWEIQFIGEDNERHLKMKLFENKPFTEFIPQDIVKTFYDKFRCGDSVKYSHPVSMLLTLSMFCEKFLNKN